MKIPIGAEKMNDGVHFRVWAPHCKKVEVIIDSKKTYPLQAEANGYFSGSVKNVEEGSLYQYILDGKDHLPDPASRFQPKGPHKESQIIDFKTFQWTDTDWKGIESISKAVIYELHIGTFTHEGTWAAAQEKLEHLLDLGITMIEIMPIHEFSGTYNWGYDGVCLYAPTHHYGHPDELRAFINEAHRLGLAVILDVVYNHFGPEGNYLPRFSSFYLKQSKTEWGDAVNFDEEHSLPVREFFIENAGYWIEEFHFDGIRIDACHSILDKTKPHILLEITRKVREMGGHRKTYVTAENEKQQVRFVFPENEDGFAMDAIWNEDFHHAAFVRLTGHKEAYFSDYSGHAREFVSSLKYNFLYQGQWYEWQKKHRGTPSLNVAKHHFIHFLENHDQIANTGCGKRLHQLSHHSTYRAMTTLFLLSPQIPLIFQGQEFASSSPFYYFCDHPEELAAKIVKGRLEFMFQFDSMNDEKIQKYIPLPHKKTTFEKSKLQWENKIGNQAHFQLHKDLIAMRKNDPVFSHLSETHIDGSVLTDDFFIIRYFSKYGERLLIINLGVDFFINPPSDPLLAPPENSEWKLKWTSEKPQYGGFGDRKIPENGNWTITGHSTSILFAEKKTHENSL